MREGPPDSNEENPIDMKKFEADLIEEVTRQNRIRKDGGVVGMPAKSREEASEPNIDRLLKKASEEAVSHLVKEINLDLEISQEEKEKLFAEFALRRLETFVHLTRARVRMWESMLAEHKAHITEMANQLRNEHGSSYMITDIERRHKEESERIYKDMKKDLSHRMQEMVEGLGVSADLASKIMDELSAQEEKIVPFVKKS